MQHLCSWELDTSHAVVWRDLRLVCIEYSKVRICFLSVCLTYIIVSLLQQARQMLHKNITTYFSVYVKLPLYLLYLCSFLALRTSKDECGDRD